MERESLYNSWLQDKEKNQTYVTEFILLGFGNHLKLKILLFLPFLVIYILTMAENILMAALIVTEQHLHKPMYFFLGNLSCLETCYTSTILPRMLESLLTGERTVSFSGCFAQYCFFACFGAAECYLLAVMSYDRYLAICKPLHYTVLMNGRVCFQLAAVSWMSGFLVGTVVTCLMSQLYFCGPNEIDHFLCDATQMIKLSCSDTSLIITVTFMFSFIFTLPPFLLTLSSYVYIISTILRIHSTTGRRKSFSTCSSHLIVLTIYYGTLIIVYVLPDTEILREPNKVFSLFFTVLTPMANPLIYSLRNNEVTLALRKAIGKFRVLRETQKE